MGSNGFAITTAAPKIRVMLNFIRLHLGSDKYNSHTSNLWNFSQTTQWKAFFSGLLISFTICRSRIKILHRFKQSGTASRHSIQKTGIQFNDLAWKIRLLNYFTTSTPLLPISGTHNAHTTQPETERLYAAARTPKELWIVPGAGYFNMHTYAGREYEQRITGFLSDSLTIYAGMMIDGVAYHKEQESLPHMLRGYDKVPPVLKSNFCTRIAATGKNPT